MQRASTSGRSSSSTGEDGPSAARIRPRARLPPDGSRAAPGGAGAVEGALPPGAGLRARDAPATGRSARASRAPSRPGVLSPSRAPSGERRRRLEPLGRHAPGGSRGVRGRHAASGGDRRSASPCAPATSVEGDLDSRHARRQQGGAGRFRTIRLNFEPNTILRRGARRLLRLTRRPRRLPGLAAAPPRDDELDARSRLGGQPVLRARRCRDRAKSGSCAVSSPARWRRSSST